MRRMVYSVAASLDGFIAGPRGEFDWIPMDPEIDFEAIFARFDVLLMGRRTYEGLGGPDADLFGKPTYVFSDTIDPSDHRGVTVVRSGRVRQVVEALRREEGSDIWLFGGGVLFRTLLDSGLVDAVEIAVVPFVLGSGIPLLAPPDPDASSQAEFAPTPLEPGDPIVYRETGTVWLAYDVKASAGETG